MLFLIIIKKNIKRNKNIVAVRKRRNQFLPGKNVCLKQGRSQGSLLIEMLFQVFG